MPEAEAVQSADNKPEIAEEFVVLIAKKKLLTEDKLLLQMFWEAVEEIDALVDKAKEHTDYRGIKFFNLLMCLRELILN